MFYSMRRVRALPVGEVLRWAAQHTRAMTAAAPAVPSKVERQRRRALDTAGLGEFKRKLTERKSKRWDVDSAGDAVGELDDRVLKAARAEVRAPASSPASAPLTAPASSPWPIAATAASGDA